MAMVQQLMSTPSIGATQTIRTTRPPELLNSQRIMAASRLRGRPTDSRPRPRRLCPGQMSRQLRQRLHPKREGRHSMESTDHSVVECRMTRFASQTSLEILRHLRSPRLQASARKAARRGNPQMPLVTTLHTHRPLRASLILSRSLSRSRDLSLRSRSRRS